MILPIVNEGLIYGIVVLGLFCSFRVLNFCDMSIDGSFPMGGAILAACLTSGIPTVPAILLAFAGGLLAGLVTSFIHHKLNVPDLLAGILTMTMLYSVNLRIMANRANVSFLPNPALKCPSLFYQMKQSFRASFPSADPEIAIMIFLIIFVILLAAIMILFFNTDLGLTMGALGGNQQLIISQGINPVIIRTMGICFGNALAAVAGCFFSMYQGSADVGMGTGTVVCGLASLMLGEMIIRSNRISLQLLRLFIGSLIYRALMVIARNYGYIIHLNPNDLNLITGILIIVCLCASKFKIPLRIMDLKFKNNKD